MGTKYEIKENNEGVLKTVITQEVEVDLSETLKNIRQTRAEFIKAWSTILEMVKAMDSYIQQHKGQNEFLVNVKDFLGEDYRLPELVSPFDAESILGGLEKFTKEESERRKDNLEEFKKEKEEGQKNEK